MTADQGEGHIVAMGGGGFSMEADNPLLDDFLLSLARRQPARVCFLPTASGDSPHYIVKFYRAFAERCIPTDLTLSGSSLPRQPRRTADLAAFLSEQDVIYVGGGNTVNLLAMWRAHGLDVLLRDALDRGTVLGGLSAGMLCWFQGGVTDSYGGLEALKEGLGFIEGTACPHYDGEAQRRPTYQRLIAEGLPAGYAVDDGAALHLRGNALVEVVTSRPTAAAYRVEMINGRVAETRLPTRFLGASGGMAEASGGRPPD
jgi:peptidase E